MPVFDKVKRGVYSIREKTKGHRKWRMFIYAGIVVFISGAIWLTQTNQGLIARNRFLKTFDSQRERIVTVYGANGEPIREFKGTYNVEIFNDKYIVIMNQNTGEHINVYGGSTIIIDESPQFDHTLTE